MATVAPPGTGSPEGGSSSTRSRLPIVPVLVLLAVVGGLVWLLLLRSSPAQQVRRLIDKQLKLAVAGRYEDLYATLSPRAKSACASDSFIGSLQEISASQPEFWNLVEYRDLHIAVQGDRAVVTYVITYNGAAVERATAQDPDVYLRAPRTIYGPTLTVAEQIATLTRLLQQHLVTPKDFDKQKKEIEKRGPVPRVESVKGQWYDDLDRHVRCG